VLAFSLPLPPSVTTHRPAAIFGDLGITEPLTFPSLRGFSGDLDKLHFFEWQAFRGVGAFGGLSRWWLHENNLGK
jgi:hypothetical protein